MNIVCITGRLTKDPEIRNAGESTIASFFIAVNRRFKDKDGNYPTDYFEVSTFGKNAEFAEKYIKKGTKVEIVGWLRQDRWNNQQDGSYRSKDVIIANTIAFAESRAASQQSNSSSPKANPKGSSGTDMSFMDVPDGIEEELPFT